MYVKCDSHPVTVAESKNLKCRSSILVSVFVANCGKFSDFKLRVVLKETSNMKSFEQN